MTLRDLLIEDHDDCDCTVEKFDSYRSARVVVLDGPKPRMLGPLWEPGLPVVDESETLVVPLRPEPVTEVDLAAAFALAGKLAPPGPLEGRDLRTVARLVPVGWRGKPADVPDRVVPGLEDPVFVAEPEFLGQWIHNNVNHGLMIMLHGLARP